MDKWFYMICLVVNTLIWWAICYWQMKRANYWRNKFQKAKLGEITRSTTALLKQFKSVLKGFDDDEPSDCGHTEEEHEAMMKGHLETVLGMPIIVDKNLKPGQWGIFPTPKNLSEEDLRKMRADFMKASHQEETDQSNDPITP